MKSAKVSSVKHHYSQQNEIFFFFKSTPTSVCGSGTRRTPLKLFLASVSPTKPGTLSVSLRLLKSKDYFGFWLDLLRSQPCVFPASAPLLHLHLHLHLLPPFVFLSIPRKIACHGQNRRDYAPRQVAIVLNAVLYTMQSSRMP